jgi:hypothetical protein
MLIPASGLLLPSPLVAQSMTWRAPSDRSAPAIADDLQLMLRVRKALLQDDRLAQHLIGVTVRDQVITLWGKVPCGDAGERAELRTRSVIGVAGVRNELNIVPASEQDEFLALERRPPARTRSSDSDATLRQDLPPIERHGETERSKEPVGLLWRPVQGERSLGQPAPASIAPSGIATAPVSGEPHTAAAPLETGLPSINSANDGLVTLPPIRIDSPPTAGSEKPRITLSLASKLPEFDPLSRSIEALRLSDPRFAAVRYRLVDRIVYLADDVDRSAARFAFAQAVSRLPGVRRVVLEDARK